MPIVFLSSLDRPDTIPDRALSPSHRMSTQSLDCAVPLKFASMKLAIPRTVRVLEPSVFLANLLSFASVNEHAVSITPSLATLSINPSDPALYLSTAGSLESVTRKKTADLRKFSVATQRLTATSLTVNDKLALVKAAEARFNKQLAIANSKLKEAEALLAKLTAAERERLAKLNDDEEDADQQKSLADASKYGTVSGRGGTAIKYALQQIGDKYVFGADGTTYWYCSGLTMRAFQAAGVSLPHSSRAQYGYGKSVARKDLQPGDLVFFGKPISHVGIYLGGNRMLHAPRKGSRVKIAEFSLGKKPYIGARRL